MMLSQLNPKRSLVGAMIALLLLLTVFFTLTTALWIGGMTRTDMLQQHQRQMALDTNEFAADMNQALSARLDAIRATTTLLSTQTDNTQQLNMLFRELQTTYPEFDWIALADTHGRIIANNLELPHPHTISQQSWWQNGLHDTWIGEISPPRHTTQNRRSLVDMAAPIRDQHGHVIAVIAAHLSWQWAQSYAQRLLQNATLPATSQLIIVDKQRHVLASSAPEQLTQQLSRTMPTTGQITLAEATHQSSYLIASARISEHTEFKRLGWQIMLVEPTAQAEQHANAQFYKIIWIALILGGSTAVLGTLLTQRLLRRLTNLTQAVNALDAPTQLLPINGNDEVQQLALAFNRVLSALGDEQQKLADLNRTITQRVVDRTREIERLAEASRYAAIIRERLQIARDLHDTLAHSMMAMLAEIRLLRKLHSHQPEALSAELANAEIIAHQGLQEARAAITQTRFNAVRDVGLGPALQQALTHCSSRTGLIINYQHTPNAANFADERADTLFHIAEEVLRNIERHAQASTVDVTLTDLDADTLSLSISDNGIGFDTETAHPGHYGLVGLREQAQLIGAQLTLTSAHSRGTHFHITLHYLPSLLETR